MTPPEPGNSDEKAQRTSSAEMPQEAGGGDPEVERASLRELSQTVLTPARNRRILIKTNAVVLTIMVLASTLAFLDKVSH